MRGIPEGAMILQMIPPQSIEVERAVLGTCLLRNKHAVTAISLLNHDDFYKQNHQLIFQSMVKLFKSGSNIDIMTVANDLESSGRVEAVGGLVYLTDLTQCIPQGSQLDGLCNIIREKSLSRKLISVTKDMYESCYEGGRVADILAQHGKAILAISGAEDKTMKHIGEIVRDVMQNIVDIHSGEKSSFGLMTGFPDIDKITGGLQRSELTIIAGRPSMGKTTLAMNMVHNIAKKGAKVLVFSLEMSNSRLCQKILSSVAGIDTKGMDRGYLTDSEIHRLTQSVHNIEKLHINIDDKSAQNIISMQAKAKMKAMIEGLDLVVVDYLQLGKANEASREREISEISAGLKALAKDLNIPVVALSQLSRKCEERTDKRPMMSDLRESGAIEQDAGVIMFVYRDDMYNKSTPVKGVTDVIIPKNRYGEPGSCKLGFEGRSCRFVTMAKREDEPV